MLVLIFALVTIGLVVLYSAVGGGASSTMAIRQVIHFIVALILLFAVSLTNDQFFLRYAYVIYFGILLLLIAVAVLGIVGMGARRWLDLGGFRLQPSEMMKVAVILALARYFHDRGVVNPLRFRDLIVPALLLGVAAGLIIKQPDLGTAVMVLAAGGVVIFVAGLPWKYIFLMVTTFVAAAPIAWKFMHDYQQKRILTLLNPEGDPLGAGYHIIQSKIAVGSGGMMGKGYLKGSQSHLDFLPEQHTDFIFSVLAEEWGFIGGMVLLGLFALLILRGLLIAANARDRFGLLVASGIISLIAFQVIINLGMVIGIFPVVGIPLPLVSYGGSSMVTIMGALGVMAHIAIHSKPLP
ncbi:MAG: rod shape-determining protein RodA [Magnetococcales bacterium]|nr:rod shape-determining protein RodA [Magnetococcales bacterium]NGZ25338.1 rod shape-determining protein RodA [Magnetococcales bacterium]